MYNGFQTTDKDLSMDTTFLASDTYAYLILPLIVFFSRIADVSIGTLRIIFVSRGRRRVAPVLGFFEVFIWIVVVSQVVQNLHSIVAYVAYAAGFATGNFVGLSIEHKLAIGTYIVRVIMPHEAERLAQRLQTAGYGVTSVDARGSTGPVTLLYTIVKRKDVEDVIGLVHQVNSKAFLTIEEARSTEMGIFPPTVATHHLLLRLAPRRKGK
jgi:uncharacterized protein YebE (UPF0316 family)